MNNFVLVTGGGPVGLTMAAELARYGVRVRVVEKSSHRTDKSKALVIWSRTLELISRMGCASAFVDAGMKASAANIVAGSQTIAHIDLGSAATPYPYALMIPQSETERLMEAHLNSLGVQVEREMELTGFAQSPDRVVSTLRHADGREETVETAWLIGCDGAHSAVRHRLGMQFLGNTQTSDWMLADVHLTGAPTPGEIHIGWHADGLLAIFPISQDRFRVIADVGTAQGATARPDPTLEEIQALLDRRGPGGVRASSPVWLASFRINERKVSDYRSERVFLAGDAAHVHSPAGGQGMNTGMQDACNLAWKLALAARSICAEEPLLDSYSQERSAVGDEVLKNASRLTTIGILRGEVKQGIRNHLTSLIFGLGPVRRAAVAQFAELSIGYPESPLNLRGAHFVSGPAPGERAPIREGETSVGGGDTPRFTVFAEAGETAAGLLARHTDLLEPRLRPPFNADGLWLVRPDGYVAVTAKRGDFASVEEFLSRIGNANP